MQSKPKILRHLPIADDELEALQYLCDAALENDFFLVNGKPELHEAMKLAMHRIDVVQENPRWFTPLEELLENPAS